MVAQENIWRDMRRVSRFIGALLTIVGGLVIVFQGFLYKSLPPADGYIRVDATVTSLERRGTFQEPAFSITLAYEVVRNNGRVEELRSGRRVDFEVFNALAKGETITIDYNPADPYEWRLMEDLDDDLLDDYALGLMMILMGGLSLIFPLIVRLASREDDFRYPEDLKAEEQKEQPFFRYDEIAHG